MPTTRLLLVRHGHTHHHERRVMGGPVGDTGLTDLGRTQVEAAGRRLAAAFRVDAVYSSPLPRARQTGELLATAVGLPSTSVSEHCGVCSYHVLPEHDGRPHDVGWSTARRGGGVALWRPEHEGGDSFGALVLRVGEALHEIADRHHGQTVVVATHNETIQASLVVLGDLPYRHRLGVSLSTASITEWATEGDTTAGGPADGWSFVDWRLVRLNDTGHLPS